MFHSIYIILLIVICLSIIIPSIILQKNPYSVIKTTLVQLLKDKKKLLHFLGLFLILYFNKIEQKISEQFSVSDYTSIIHDWEGNIVYYIQKLFLNGSLTYVLTFFYIIVFPTLMVSSIVVYLNRNDLRSFYSLVYALMLTYGIAIPFFMFFPVYEVWYFDPNVHFLIPDIYPRFEIEYRPMSGLNNNLPSLHTAISVSMALIALHSRDRNFGKLVFICSSIIVFSTIYLGIHWLADLSAGIILAVIASQTGLRISERYEHSPQRLSLR